MILRKTQRLFVTLVAASVAFPAFTQELLVISPDGAVQTRIGGDTSSLVASTNPLATLRTVETEQMDMISDPPETPLVSTSADVGRALITRAEPTPSLEAQSASEGQLVATAEPEPELVATAEQESIAVAAPALPPPPPATVPIPLPKGTTVRFEGVLFEFDSAELKPEAQPLIRAFAVTLLQHLSVQIRLEGHTDSQGSDAYNLELSRDRAEAVHEALVRQGLDPSRLAFVGYGETRPIASNDDDTGRSRNRRVDAVVVDDLQ